MFSILILTCNEEDNLQGCLDSIPWCDDIVVLDSFSSDSTVAIAENAGNVRLFQRVFDDFAGQRNYGLDEVEFKHDWIFHLDADEQFTDALRQECLRMIELDACSGYQVPSMMMLWGRWLKHAADYPVYQMRFHKLGEVRFEQFGHGQRECGAKRGIGIMKEPYEHHSFGKGLSKWFDRHNRYSSSEADETIEHMLSGRFSPGNLFSSDRIKRRRTLKELSFRLPFRPSVRFLYQYMLCMGFLDGYPGFAYCYMLALYEAQIVMKVKEHKMRNKGIQT